MPRTILISNGQFALALDDKACIRDVYFPYIGLENHAVAHPFRFGVWVDGRFSHAGAPLAEIVLDGEVLTCPWHYAQFRISDGSVLRGPAYK
jgi:hypothetical protein